MRNTTASSINKDLGEHWQHQARKNKQYADIKEFEKNGFLLTDAI